MVFCSNRPRHKGEGRRQDHDFWISDRTLHEWGEPRLFAIEALSDAEDYFPIITQSGNFYFNSQREGAGTNNIFRSRFVEGRYLAAEKLPAPINSRYREFDAWVSPDEKMIVFASERPGGKGGSDLYISFLQDNGSWATPRNLGPGVNTRGWEYGPRPSVDGKFLFYTSTQGHNENIYWVSTDVLQTHGGGGLRLRHQGFGFLIVLAGLSRCVAQDAQYIDPVLPDTLPRLFAAGVISTERCEHSAVVFFQNPGCHFFYPDLGETCHLGVPPDRWGLERSGPPHRKRRL